MTTQLDPQALLRLTIRYLPGTGGHSPADGFNAKAGPPTPIQLPGVILAAPATLSLGAVLGPEAPLIALGGGLGVLTVRLARRDAPARTSAVVASAGSFAAISTLLGSDGVPVMPLVIVAVTVAYIASARLTPAPQAETAPSALGTSAPVSSSPERAARSAERMARSAERMARSAERMAGSAERMAGSAERVAKSPDQAAEP